MQRVFFAELARPPRSGLSVVKRGEKRVSALRVPTQATRGAGGTGVVPMHSLLLTVPVTGQGAFVTGDWLALGVVGFITMLGIIFSLVPVTVIGPTMPITALTGAAVSVAAAVALLRSFAWSDEGQAASILAIGLTAGAATNLLTFVGVTLGPTHLTHLPDGPNISLCSDFVWYTVSILAVTAYLFQRYRCPLPVKRSAAVLAGLITSALVFGLEWEIAVAPAMLPHLAPGQLLHGIGDGGSGMPLLAGFAVTVAGTARLRRQTSLDRAILWMQISLGLGLFIALLGGDFASPSFACSRMLQICGVAFVAIGVIKWMLDSGNLRLLALLAEESRFRAERIRAIWAMAAVREKDQFKGVTRMLELSCPAIRPQKPMRASLSHIDGENIIIDAVFASRAAASRTGEFSIIPGTKFPFPRSVQSLVNTDGKARAWNDISQSEIAGLSIARETGAKSLIATAVQIGSRRYFITYSSPETMNDAPFTEDDLNFIDIVAAQISSTFRHFDFIERLRYQMEHDALTGLGNRAQFVKAIKTEISKANPFAVCIFNLDRFRTLNERHGRMLADDVLVEIAAELTRIDTENVVARLNGDEFGVLLRWAPNAKAQFSTNVERYLARFDEPFHCGDRDGTRMLAVKASAGYSLFPGHGTTTEDLMRSADVAVEIAKERGGACAVVFDSTMAQIIERRGIAVADLTRGLANDEFRLVYQPTFDLENRRIIGAEALIRWDHPELGELLPGEFIPMAEQTGAIASLSLWVLSRITRDISSIPLPSQFRCYFNLSAPDLADFRFARSLTDSLAQNPGLADSLGIEITETTAMQNVERALNTIAIIRSLGVRIAIDDFGTGYSSLSYLKRLPVDLIKIDRAFVMGLPDDDRDVALAEALIGICDRFNVTALAEGIESESQRKWLFAHGCRFGQGHLLSKPMTFDELVRRLDSQETIIM